MRQKIKKHYIFIILMLLVTVVAVDASNISFGQPGSSDDPLVTISYVEKRIEQLKYYIDEKLGGGGTSNTEIQRLIEENEILKKQVGQLMTTSSGGGLEIVELRNGQKLICGAGTEIILRGGAAKAIVSSLGGLSDLTGGTDLVANQAIPANHLLLVPRDDGRGVYVENYAIFIVRGYYEVR
ncbi:hypothetical protein SAMN05660462_02876 [Proteiniborus ethanoligenes]|uniref:Uncharacterized protein n=1 Tax=Proteiniborus ethanoligenes TaxID=415015 RepID=A0A1H3SEY8_9FIRM|nr:hypothetical protein [Proteiniborus ethanoligenes]SDZ36643.1 hypothetical protein SAMN05660462_02876 [Proteiniborus ethanoligenes]